MEDGVQERTSKSHMWYARLDRLLLYLLAAELGYFILLMLAGVVVTILVYTMDFAPQFYKYETSILWPVLIYILALPLNLLGGFAGLVLNIRAKHQGYPGTGHLLNWVFLATTAWLFIVAIVFLLPEMARGY